MLALLAALGGLSCTRPDDGALPDPLALDAPALAAAIAAGRFTAEAVTTASLERIAAIDDAGPELNAIIEINPDALAIARELDRRYRSSGVVGPLHGVPVVLKANIDTGDAMATTAGSLALAAHRADADAPLVARLRAAGAVIIGKSNLSEWANFRSFAATSGWSSLGGQTRNAWLPERSPCGSSSGSAVAVAARLVPLAVGTETDGSIVCPAGINGIVGIKPTVGLIEQEGIIPIAATQDTAGPMARTVRGAALLLHAMQAMPVVPLPSPQPEDVPPLAGFRLGALRDRSIESVPGLSAAYARWIALLEAAGAEVVDPIALELGADVRGAELEVLLHEFRAGIDAYLAGVDEGPGSLAELIAFNAANAAVVMPHFGQDILVAAAARGDLDSAEYREALAASRDVVRERLAGLFGADDLDALIAPANGPAWPIDYSQGDLAGIPTSSVAAISGYPSVVVPAAVLDGHPIALAFIGEPLSEPLLIGIAAAFEAARGDFGAPALVGD